jgi:hypothetical protein
MFCCPCRNLKTLELSDNDNLSGSLPGCFLASQSLQELQLAGLSQLRGPLPLVTTADAAAASTASTAAPVAGGGSSASMPKRRALLGEMQQQQQQQQQGCGFGKLQYVNMAGVIGDQEPGLTGELRVRAGTARQAVYLKAGRGEFAAATSAQQGVGA